MIRHVTFGYLISMMSSCQLGYCAVDTQTPPKQYCFAGAQSNGCVIMLQRTQKTFWSIIERQTRMVWRWHSICLWLHWMHVYLHSADAEAERALDQ